MEFLLPFGQESFVLPYDSKNINLNYTEAYNYLFYMCVKLGLLH